MSESPILHSMQSKEALKWKIIESEYLHRRPWLTVRKEKVQLPTGAVIPEFYVMEFPDWTNVIGVTKDEKIVLIRQYRHGIADTHYELPAGVADPTDKNFMDAARRELLEETGYGNGNWQDWMLVAPNPAIQSNFTHCYLATGVEELGPQDLEASEQISVHLFSIEEVEQLLLQNQIVQALQVAPLWKYIACHKEKKSK